MSSILEKNTVSELSIWASTPPMPIKAKPFDLILYRSLTDVAHTEIKLNFHIFTNAKIETVGIQIFIAQNLHFIVCKVIKSNCPIFAYIPKNPIKEKLRYVTTSRPVLKWYCFFPNYSHVTWVIHAPTMTCENTQYHLLVPADRLFGSRISWESFFVILELTPKRLGSKRSKFDRE